MTSFAPDELDHLASPHVARAWFFRFDLPTGQVRLHSGVGRVKLDDLLWLGVSDPLGGRVLSVGKVAEPRFGQAAAITVSLSAVTSAFLSEFWAGRRALEGRAADVWWAAVDIETQEVLIGRKRLFPHATMTSPKIASTGVGGRVAALTIESLFVARNYPPGGRWNPSDQRRRYPGDKGLDFIGVAVTEHWR